MPQRSLLTPRAGAVAFPMVLLSMVVASPALAVNDIFVTLTADVVDPTDGELSLREAFDIANTDGEDSVIHLQPGALYLLTRCHPGMLDDDNVFGDLDHTAPDALDILGVGARIHNTCAGERVLENHQQDATLLLWALTLSGGDSTDLDEPGGAVRSFGDLFVYDSVIRNNHAERAAGIFGGDKETGEGVAIRIERSAIIDNDGTAVHGGEYSGSVEVYDSDISRNGGTGITLSFGPITVERSSLHDNSGSGIGAVDGTPVRVADTSVLRNGGNGIGTTGQGYSRLTLERVLVEDNGAVGVVCSFCRDVLVRDSTIRGHHPTFGLGGGLRIITGNVGEVGMADPHDLRIERSVIEDNSALQGGGGVGVLFGGDPGGVRPLLVIRNSTIRWNRTGPDGVGGGVFLDEGDLTIVNSAISMNSAGQRGDTGARGGGVYFTGDLLDIERTTIDENVAHGWAGGVFTRALGGLVERSIVAFNEAKAGPGGGLYAERGELTVLTSQVWKNRASGSGGGIAFVSGPPPGEELEDGELSPVASLYVHRATLHANRAGAMGGGVFFDDSTGTYLFENSTVHDNRAQVSGGGFRLEDAVLLTYYTTITANRAPLGSNVDVRDGFLVSVASVIAEGQGSPDCEITGTLVTSLYSASGDASCGFGLGAGDQVDIGDPRLEPLENNGGPTPTRMPRGSSPLVNAIPPLECIEDDQRFVSRPQGGGCDVGSVERDKAPPKKTLPKQPLTRVQRL